MNNAYTALRDQYDAVCAELERTRRIRDEQAAILKSLVSALDGTQDERVAAAIAQFQTFVEETE